MPRHPNFAFLRVSVPPWYVFGFRSRRSRRFDCHSEAQSRDLCILPLVFRSPDHPITKSSDHQITRLPIYLITKFPTNLKFKIKRPIALPEPKPPQDSPCGTPGRVAGSCHEWPRIRPVPPRIRRGAGHCPGKPEQTCPALPTGLAIPLAVILVAHPGNAVHLFRRRRFLAR
jgi:hypothetical protein